MTIKGPVKAWWSRLPVGSTPTIQHSAQVLCLAAGLTTKSGEVVFHSGHRFHALINLDASSSCENYGVEVAVIVGDDLRILNQGENEYEAWVKEATTWEPPLDPHSYEYRYYDQSDDGWSLH